MSVTNYLTNSGRQLVAKLLAGQRLVYTRAVATADTAPTQPELLTTFTNVAQTAVTLTAEQQGNYAIISATFSCQTLEASYQLRMVGIYAKIEGTDSDTLYMVTVYDPDDGAVTLPAGQCISYRFVTYDAIADGTLSITVADSASAPFEHVLNPYRHIFTQTNTDTAVAIVNAGDYIDFTNGQQIVFVPVATLVGNSSTLYMSGKTYDLLSVDLAGEATNCLFIPYKTYVLRYLNGAFYYVKHNTIEYVDGVGHYWTGTSWATVVPAGQLVTSAASVAPAGTLLCDGSSISRADYPELFSAIGTKYGSSGNGTFRLPDLRGRCVVGVSSNYALGTTGGTECVALTTAELPVHTPSGTITASTPAHNHTFTTGSAGSHTHTVAGKTASAGTHTHSGTWTYRSSSNDHSSHIDDEHDSSRWYESNTGSAGAHTHTIDLSAASAGSHTHTGTTGSKAMPITCAFSGRTIGNGSPHNNMQPYMALNIFIYTGRSLL